MLVDICQQALLEGKKIDLKGCLYGEPHWQGPVPTFPFIYYHFLAGLVKSQQLTYVFEIGTHFGGSIMAMSRGVGDSTIEESKLVTVDVTYMNADAFRHFPRIQRIQGDAVADNVVKKVVAIFDRPVDLMYIDSHHSYAHVKTCLDIYARKLNPKYIVLDDIFLNRSMKKLWRELVKAFGKNVLDITDITVRGRSAGFGIIDWGSIPYKY